MKINYKFTEKYLAWMKLPEPIQDEEPIKGEHKKDIKVHNKL